MDYKTPGVYVEEIPKFPPSVVGVATAVPAFIGYTEKATAPDGGDLTNRPTRIDSLAEYELLFGRALEVTVTVAGGAVTKVEPAPLRGTLRSALELYFANGGQLAYIVSVGSDAVPAKDPLISGIRALEAFDEPTLVVIPDAVTLDAEGCAEVQQAALAHCAQLGDRFAILDVRQDAGAFVAGVADFRTKIGSDHLNYGAAYGPYLLVGLRVPDSRVKVGDTTLTLLEDRNQAALVRDHLQARRIEVPPSPAIAAVYARTDGERGVWKAPANVSLAGVIGPTVEITTAQNDGLNVDPSGKSVNAIRTFTGRGTLVWGARTLAGNDNEWRYVNVRRFFLFVEESVKKATEQFTFEPNDANTWVKVKAMVENFLTLQWRAGALQGVKPEHAFYVAVGLGTTMTADDVLNGRMIVEIGMAAVRPAEFIVLRFSHKMPES